MKTEKSKIEFIDLKDRKKEERKRMKELIFYSKWKILSLVLVLFNLVVIGALLGGAEGFFNILVFLIFPVALIWAPDFFGTYSGSSLGLGGAFHRRIYTPTPALILKIAGWGLLLYPSIKIIIIFLFIVA